MTKADLLTRIQRLQAARDAKAAAMQAELDEYDRRLGLLRPLLRDWDTTLIDSALATLSNAGFPVRTPE